MAQGRRPNEKEKTRICTEKNCNNETNDYRCKECWARMRSKGDVSDNSGHDPDVAADRLGESMRGSCITSYQS